MNEKKIALVTGGTGGIGSAICIGLAQQGRQVIAGYYPPEQEAAEAWQRAPKSRRLRYRNSPRRRRQL